MQPLDQQSEQLFEGQTQASDLVGAPPCAAFQAVAWALAVALESSI